MSRRVATTHIVIIVQNDFQQLSPRGPVCSEEREEQIHILISGLFQHEIERFVDEVLFFRATHSRTGTRRVNWQLFLAGRAVDLHRGCTSRWSPRFRVDALNEVVLLTPSIAHHLHNVYNHL